MPSTEKTKAIEELKSRFDRAVSVALLDYQGLSVETVTALRREFKKAGVEYKVLKNTIIRHALKESPYKVLVGDLSPTRKNAPKPHEAVRGMTGVAFSYTDPAAPAKVVEDFRKSFGDKTDKVKGLKVKTGMVGGDLIAGDELAKMPGLKENQAQIVAMLLGPSAGIYTSLVAPGAVLVGLLEAWVEKRKAAGETE